MNSKVKPANPHILGSQVRDSGTDFAIWAGDEAGRVELCLFDQVDGVFKERHFELTHRDGAIWHGHIEGVGVGQRCENKFAFRRRDIAWDCQYRISFN